MAVQYPLLEGSFPVDHLNPALKHVIHYGPQTGDAGVLDWVSMFVFERNNKRVKDMVKHTVQTAGLVVLCLRVLAVAMFMRLVMSCDCEPFAANIEPKYLKRNTFSRMPPLQLTLFLLACAAFRFTSLAASAALVCEKCCCVSVV